MGDKMKKTILTVGLIFLIAFVAVGFQPREWVQKSGNQTASATISSDSGYLYGIIVATDSTGTLIINTYDSSDAEVSVASVTPKLHPTWRIIGASTERMRKLWFDPPVACNAGIRVEANIQGGGSVSGYEVYYRKS